jgi:hypothetical protein
VVIAKRLLLLLAALAGCALLAACDEGYKVLKEQDLDDVPVLIRVAREAFGFRENEVLLALVAAPIEKVRIPRGQARILAVFEEDSKQFSSLKETQNRELASFDWRYAGAVATSGFGVVLPESLGLKRPLEDPNTKAIWVRAASNGPAITLEVGFATQPQVVRKATYKPAEDGLSINLESGAKLQVQMR